MTPTVDILIPTFRRPSALAVTLTSLIPQTFRDFRIVVSDQTEDFDAVAVGEVQAVIRVLRLHGHAVETLRHLPRKGMAEQRDYLMSRSSAPYALFLDDDLILESDVVERMVRGIREAGCGFVGCAPIGLSFLDDLRPGEQAIEFWDGALQPERIAPGSPQWDRHKLHNAANLYHVQQHLGILPAEQRMYRVAWVGGCVLYQASALRSVGGFGFWRDLPPDHAGEDVLAQLRVMARFGGCGLMPSGVYHQELATTVPDRRVDAPKELRIDVP